MLALAHSTSQSRCRANMRDFLTRRHYSADILTRLASFQSLPYNELYVPKVEQSAHGNTLVFFEGNSKNLFESVEGERIKLGLKAS